MTSPNPGTISFPLGITKSFTLSFLSCELVVELVELVDVVVEEPFCVVDPVDVDDWVVTVVVVISIVTAGAIIAVTDSVCVDWALMDLLITELGFVGLIGEIGEVGLFILVAVIVQVSEVTDQAVHVGEPYGSEHIELLDSVIKPLYPG